MTDAPRPSAEALRAKLKTFSPEQRAALERRLAAAKAGAAATGTAIPRIPRDPPPAASFAQERLWFIDRLAPGTAAYNMPAVLRLAGAPDHRALEDAIGRIVARHEALRTALVERDGRPVQLIAPPPAAWPIAVEDLSDCPVETVTARVAAEAETPFDLARPFKLRSRLLKLADDDHLLLITLHHVASDGWSLGVLTAEIGAHYAAAREGRDTDLPPLACQYADFAAWQRGRLSGAALEREIDHWRRTLDGFVPGEFPTDRPRPAEQRFEGAVVSRRLPAALAAKVDAAARRHKATPFIILLAAFNALLARWSGEVDVSVGIPVANRTHPDLEALIGFFVNALVVRVPLHGDPTMDEIITRSRAAATTAYDHQDLPFERLVAELAPERDPSRPPLFRIAFAVQNAPRGSVTLPGLELRPFTAEITRTRMEMEWHVFERRDETGAAAGLDLVVAHATALFDRATVERLIDGFTVLLEAGLDRPETRLSALPVMTAAMERAVLTAGRGPDPQAMPAPDLSRVLAERLATDRVVVAEAGGPRLTGHQLQAQVDRMAAALAARGLAPETPVLLLMDRGIDQITATLAIWRAGLCQMPVDPAQPDARLAAMIAGGAPGLAISDPDGLARLSTLAPDLPRCGPADLNAEPRPLPAVHGDQLAWMIFTSGSTGTPKATLVTHGGALNTGFAQARMLGLGTGDRVAQLASPGFDAALSELLMALIAGAELMPVPAAVARDPLALGEFLAAERVTVATLTPSMLAAIGRDLPDLAVLLVAGEACPPELVRRFAPGRRMVNAYGPTECAVCATMAVGLDAEAGPPPIGTAIDGTELLILDPRGRPVPDGVAGELCIGGAGVGRGYAGRPDLTAERFVPHPAADRPGARLYRSGDLVRRRPDGALDYLGRIDTQIKLGGNRIEPGEIEAVLRADPDVADAVVDVIEMERPVAAAPADAGSGPAIALRPADALADGRRLELWPSIAEHFVYDETLYHAMTHDEARNAHYRAAIRAAVPGKVVVDIGTGADAILARLCVEAGAAKVYAVELLKASADAARATVRRLGLDDRIIVVEGDARRVTLPEPADICVSEIIGPIGGCEGSAVILNDVWRLLKPGAEMIPARTVSMVAGLELPAGFREAPGFSSLTAGYVRRIFEDRGGPFDLRLCLKGIGPDDLLTDAAVFEDLDHAGPVATESRHHVVLTTRRAGHLSGLTVWLKLEAARGRVMDTLGEICCWLPVFLPVFGEGRPVAAGSRIAMTITRTLHANGINPDFRLTGTIEMPDGTSEPFDWFSPNHGAGAGFRASPFYRRIFPETAVPDLPAPTASPGTDRRLVAWVTARGGADPEGDAALARDRVEEWRALYETAGPAAAETAADPTPETDPEDALFAGWNSSYTGRPIPVDEMRDWRDRTVAAIRRALPAGRPAHIAEIGCGAGLLLEPLAPEAASILGTDFSAATLAGLETRLAGHGWGHIRLERQEAADPLPIDHPVDLVVMNSVAQYFPAPAHLEKVLLRIGTALAGGGAAFLGDIRDHGLAEIFQASVLAHQAGGTLPDRESVARAVAADEELMLDPAWFHGLIGRIPGLAHVETLIKRGRGDNELVRYRYDVMAVFGAAPAAIRPELTLPWPGPEALATRLATVAGPVEVTDIPDARIAEDTARAMRLGLVPTTAAGDTADPDSLHELGLRLGRAVRLAPAASGIVGAMDALFDVPGLADDPLARGWMRAPLPRGRSANDPRLANDPLARRRKAALADRLRRRAREVLPAAMVPQAVMVLDRLPLGASGKLDRARLPQPETAAGRHPARDPARALPADRLEAALLALWEELLGTAPIGVEDDFFALGGHSLLGVRLVAEVKARLGGTVPLDLLMRAGSVRAMAAHLKEAGELADDGAGTGRLVPLRRDGSGAPLFCLPPGGGTVFCYGPLVDRLAPGRPVWGLQAAGVEPGETPHESLDEMAAAYLAAIRHIQPKGPYHLIGWSFGGHVAYQMAAALEAAGEEVALLALLDTFPPEHVPRVDERYRREEAYLAYLAGLAGLAVAEDELAPLTSPARLRLVADRAVAAGALPARDAEGTVRRLLALTQISGRLAREATLPGYGGPLAMLRAAEALTPALEDLARRDPACGWGRHATGPLTAATVPGRHDTMMTAPHVDRLATVIDHLLTQTVTETAAG
ncbi:amino acid adenylation domain-containing protein [Tistrella mobilis]|uniref:amino acid adenylation domain-containing protein n=1 Tax=Tistrella mobilis TaxID=171437 RepID=UPI0035591A77